MIQFIEKKEIVSLFISPIFLSAVTSWLLSQIIKTIISLITSSVHTLNDFFQLMVWRTGGMPSSHSALVASLATSLGVKYGIGSDFFIFAFFSAIIIIRDAVGVRRSNGLQAKTLNELCRAFNAVNAEWKFKKVKEIHGHTPIEVIAGIILGIIISLLYSFLF